MSPPDGADAAAASIPSQVRDVGRSVGVLAVGEAVNKVARFAAMILLARALPLDEFGLLNTAIALGGIATVLMRFGLPDLGARDVAADPAAAPELAGRIMGPQGAGMIVLTLVATAIVALIDVGSAAFAAMAGASMFGLSVSGDWLLRGLNRMRAVASASAIGGLVVLAASFALTQVSDEATIALIGFAIGELVAAVASWRFAGLLTKLRPTLAGTGALLRRSWPIALSAIAIYAFYANVDTIILAATRSASEAGLYSAPYRLFLALNAVVLFAAQALLPVVTQAAVGDPRHDTGAALLRASIRPLLGYGLLCLGVAEVVGEPLLGLLFGDRFEAVSSTFVLLCLAIPWYAIGFPAGYALIARDRSRAYLRGAIVAGIANLGLNFALIPPLGTEGAAIATVVAFGAGALTWLAAQELLRAAIPALIALALASGGATIAVAAPDSATVSGVGTLIGAVFVLAGAPAATERRG